MIINDKDAIARLNSPNNLINRLCSAGNNKDNKKNNAMSLFGLRPENGIVKKIENPKAIETFNPFAESTSEEKPVEIPDKTPNEPDLDTILVNNESKIKLGLAHDNALDLLNRSVEMLSLKLDDVSAAKLPAVISAASKTVESIRKERNEAAKLNKDKEVHYHFYTPQQKNIKEYEIIDVA